MENKLRFMGGIICNSSAVDQATQNLSAFNIIDQISIDLQARDPSKVIANAVEKIPLPINFQVISLWKRKNLSDIGKDVSGNIEVEIIDPLGNTLGAHIVPFAIPKNIARTRHIMNMNGFTITMSGEYLFQYREIYSNGEKGDIIATSSLDIAVNKK